MFGFRKKKEDVPNSSAGLPKSKITEILGTVPTEKVFYFYEGIGRPVGHVAKSLVDFRNKINTVRSSSLVFHMRRRDFERWFTEVVGDLRLASQVRSISPDDFYLKEELYKIVDKRIRRLEEMLSTSTIVYNHKVATQGYSQSAPSR